METREPRTVGYEFGPFRVDAADYLLLRDGKTVSVPPKVFELLLILIEHRGHTLEKDRLMQTLWPNVFVEESSLSQLIFQLRKSLGVSASGQQYIETIPKRGYRFVADVKLVPRTGEVVITSQTGTHILIEEESETADVLTAPLSEVGISNNVAREVPTATAVALKRQTTGERAAGQLRTSHKRRRVVIAAALSLLIVGGLAFFWYLIKYRTNRVTTIPFQRVNYRKLTASGKAILPAISPDGRYAAYVLDDTGRQSLWVRQITTTSRVQIILPNEVVYQGLTFSSDGQLIYYVQSRKNEPAGELFQVPVFGGTPRKVITGIASPITFSPDGKRFAFVRSVINTEETALVIADADGSNAKALTTRRRPNYFSTKGPAWSPDGGVIVVGAGVSDSKNSYRQVLSVRVADGTETPLGSVGWGEIGQAAWLDDNGVVVTLWPQDSAAFASQLWYFSYPGGEARQVMNDLVSFEGISIASRSGAMVVGRSDRVSRIWVTTPNKETQQIKSSMGDNYSETFGLDWTPDGKIVYGSHGSGNSEIWIMDGDGRNQRQLTFDQRRETWPNVTPDGRTIVFVSSGQDGTHLWRMDSDGGSRKQLTYGKGESYPNLSPDGRWVVFTSMERGWPTIGIVSIEGGEPRLLTQKASSRPVVSPDGKTIACFYFDDRGSQMAVGLIAFEGGEPTKLFNDLPIPDWNLLKWTPDGLGLGYIMTRDGASNIWVQPLDGGSPRKITDFKEDRIYRFAWSRDGKTLALDRGFDVNDIVVATELQ